MKICILSMQRVHNFGSLLQAYSLKKMLEQLGHQVSFLDIERNEADALLGGPEQKLTIGEVFLRKLQKIDRYAANRVACKIKNKQQDLRIFEFQKKVLGLDFQSNGKQYDCCVIGSDEVFNCMAASPWGFTGQLFGDVHQVDRVITYAASCGSTNWEEIPKPINDRIRNAFEKVSGFSVRDNNTLRMASNLTQRPVLVHLDPVLVGNFEEEIQNAPRPKDLPERYCVVYSYYNRICESEEIASIQNFCKKHRMEIVTVGAPQMWVKHHCVMDPFAVPKVFAGAEFVVTDTFHGTLFSAKYAKRFAVKTRPSNQNKLGDLIQRLAVQQHEVNSFLQLEAAYAKENDRKRIAELCAAERERTIRYLRESVMA